jgi:hypothetical protein
MATRADQLQTLYDATITELADVTSKRRVQYSVDGQSVSWGEYEKRLLERLATLRAEMLVADGPFEVTVYGH